MWSGRRGRNSPRTSTFLRRRCRTMMMNDDDDDDGDDDADVDDGDYLDGVYCLKGKF